MPSTYQVDIQGAGEGSPVSFAPRQLVCNAGDSIFWHNLTAVEQQLFQFLNGKPLEPPMTLPIPAGGPSSVFSPGPNTTDPAQPYELSYGLKNQREPGGSITVNPQA
jgi:hypothetical protein